MNHLWLYALAVFLLYFFLVLAPAYCSYRCVFGLKKPVSFLDRDLSRSRFAPYADRILDDFAFFNEQTPERITLYADDGVLLIGEYYTQTPNNDRVIVCVHGYNSTPLNNFASMARFFMEDGYDVLLVHQRAHGVSGGRHATMGLCEQYDLLVFCRWLCNRPLVRSIILAGVSMGCATVGYASDKLNDSKIRGMILDCGFTTPLQQMKEDCRHRYFPLAPLLSHVCFFTRHFLHINVRQPVWASLEKTTIPAFFLHGKTDEAIPYVESELNYQHCASEKQLYLLDDACHAGTFLAGGEPLQQALHAFADHVTKGELL